MSFQEILKTMVEGVEGALAATLMGMDGIPVDQFGEYDAETVGIEYGKVIEEIRNASSILKLGAVEEVMVATTGTDVLLRMATPEYYIAFVLRHGSNIGKARFLLKKAALDAAPGLK